MGHQLPQLTPRMQRSPPFTLEVPGYEKVPGETIPRRSTAFVDGLVGIPEPGIETVYDIISRAAKKFGDDNAHGSRRILDTITEEKNGKKWSYYELSGYEFVTYKEHFHRAQAVGSGLRKLGLTSADKIHIYGGTTANWILTAHGAACQSITIATAYESLGEEGLTHSLTATKSKLVYLDAGLLPSLTKPLKTATDIKFVVYNKEAEKKHLDAITEAYPNIKVLSIDELLQLGKDNPVEDNPPKYEDLCAVMYTSGSTGVPKGVSVKHKAVIGAVAGGNTTVEGSVGHGDAYLGFLPLAHIVEYVLEHCCFYWGATIGYATPRTLTDASVRNCKGDLPEFKPTIMVGVPAIWETVRKGITGKVNEAGALTKNLFWGALAAKSFLMRNHLPGSGILDAVVFSKVKAATGGRLRLTMNGAGPIAKDTQIFLSMVICPMICGYGLTETSGMAALCDPREWTSDAIGRLPSAIELKLVDVPDLNYFAENNQGEILVRGPAVLDSYYENEEETKKAITPDGWFRTGDVGEWDKNGHLKIIDRVKNLVKTLNGEYIAIEKLESRYSTSPLVAALLVFASKERARPSAIFVPNEAPLRDVLKKNDYAKPDAPIGELAKDDKAKKIVLAELQRAGKEHGLTSLEIIDEVIIVDGEWTPQNGMLTAAQKLNRKAILAKYEPSR